MNLRDIKDPTEEWLVGRSGVMHAFEPGARRSVCRMIDRPTLVLVKTGRLCRACTATLAPSAPPASWPATWEIARRDRDLAVAMNAALDELGEALAIGNTNARISAYAMIRKVESAALRATAARHHERLVGASGR